MGNYKGPTKGGSGGKRGHSGMDHWTTTEEIKESSKISRRQEDLRYSKEGIDETTRKLLTAFWFPLNSSLGIGVTAYSKEQAYEMAKECQVNYFSDQELEKPIVGVTVSELDQGHIVPNMGPINLLGVWYPKENL